MVVYNIMDLIDSSLNFNQEIKDLTTEKLSSSPEDYQVDNVGEKIFGE